jgi:hypothetical protein
MPSSKFRSAFNEANLKLSKKLRRGWEAKDPEDIKDYLATEVVRTTHQRHLEAIERFRPYVPKRRRKDVNLAADNYCRLADEYLQTDSAEEVWDRLELDDSDQKRREDLLSRMHDLFKYAENI